MLYATPHVSPITGALSIRICESKFDGNGDAQIDIVAIDGHGTYTSEHDVPMSVMSEAFKKRFADGGRYRQLTVWDYPFAGYDQIGCQVEQLR